MSTSRLDETIEALLAPGKGILAADESGGTCDKRFEKYNIPKTEEMRRRWRQILFTTSDTEKWLSGVILFDETIRQKDDNGRAFPELLVSRGIIPGIKVDQGTGLMGNSPDEKLTNGLQGLPRRLDEYAKMGARFAKWRALIQIGDKIPTEACVHENARRLAIYALDCQRAGLVPILEPEVDITGTHSMQTSETVLAFTLAIVFSEAHVVGVNLKQILLKSSMALPGDSSGITPHAKEIAESTVRAFCKSVPKDVPGIVFLSGGQTPQEATVRLNEIVKLCREQKLPWRISFSYSRALQEPALATWLGMLENEKTAQDVFRQRVMETALASEGKFI